MAVWLGTNACFVIGTNETHSVHPPLIFPTVSWSSKVLIVSPQWFPLSQAEAFDPPHCGIWNWCLEKMYAKQMYAKQMYLYFARALFFARALGCSHNNIHWYTIYKIYYNWSTCLKYLGAVLKVPSRYHVWQVSRYLTMSSVPKIRYLLSRFWPCTPLSASSISMSSKFLI